MIPQKRHSTKNEKEYYSILGFILTGYRTRVEVTGRTEEEELQQGTKEPSHNPQ
jgi:hypothetical protein